MAMHNVLELTTLHNHCAAIRSESDPYILGRRMAHLLNYYGMINFDVGFDGPFLRARICEGRTPYKKASELGCPPPAISTPQRLNSAGKPVLYLARRQHAVIAEIGAQVGDFVQIMFYEHRGGAKLRCGVLGEIYRSTHWGGGIFGGKLGAELSEHVSRMDYEAGSSFGYTDAFLASLMRDKFAENNDYLHSRTLAEMLFSRNPHVDAIIYSGVALEGSLNLAVLPSAAERLLEPKASIVIRITEKFDFGFCRFERLMYAPSISPAGIFEWQ